MANIVEDLNLRTTGEEDTSVVYFFIRHDLFASMKAKTVIGAIVRQIMRTRQGFADAMENDDGMLNAEDFLRLLRRSTQRQKKIFLILDGLDLCADAEKQEVTEFIRKLQEQSLVLVCVSYRQEPNVVMEPLLQRFRSVKAVPLPNNETDIETFIETELSRCIETRSLILSDPTLILDIQDALLSGSQGMFLWVVLQIHSLCALQTDDEIRDALLYLPQDLSTVYAHLLRKKKGPATTYQRRVFELIAAAERPLTTSEIRETLSVTPGHTTWVAGKLINDVYSALSACGCLVVIDEEELTVRFVHHTVLQYLFERYHDPMKAISIDTCHRAMAEIVATYLSYEVFETDVSTFVIPRLQVGSTPSGIIASTAGTSISAQNIALRLLKLRRRADFDIGRTVAEGLQAHRQDETMDFAFHQYAKEYCLVHAIEAREMGTQCRRLLPVLLTALLSPEAPSHDSSVKRRSMLSFIADLAVEYDAADIIKLMVPTYRTCVDKFGTGLIYIMLTRAMCLGSEAMVQLLGKQYKTSPSLFAPITKASLCCWAYGGTTFTADNHVRSADISDADMNHICKSGRSLLACAVWGSNYNAFKSLMGDTRTDVNSGGFQMTPLWEAMRMASQASSSTPGMFQLSGRGLLLSIQLTQEISMDMLSDLISSGKVFMPAEEKRGFLATAKELSNKEVCDLLERSLVFA